MHSSPLVIDIPHESAPMAAIWTAFPSHEDLWLENLPGAQAEVAAMVEALATAGPVRLLANGAAACARARALCPLAEVIPADFGDIWLRDTGPIFARVAGRKSALLFRTNGWGGKYLLPHDDTVNAFVAAKAGVPALPHDFVLEGGALEFDGAGTALTTRECLLNENRNGPTDEDAVTRKLKEVFGLTRVVWLNGGLANDHTDGHIDNVARFVGPGHVLCQRAGGTDDPNADLFAETAARLRAEGFQVSQIPSPGRIEDEDGEAVAASHMNYIIYNGVIVLPTYGNTADEAAAALGAVFPQHRVIPLPARHILTGGGSFHCITQQEILA